MTKGNRIKKLRESLGLAQTDVAKTIGVSKQTLYKYENDIVTNIPSDKIEALARVLDSTPEYIMGWIDEDGEKTVYGHINDNDELSSLIDSLSEAEKKQVFDFLHQILKLNPEARTSLLNLLKTLVPGT